MQLSAELQKRRSAEESQEAIRPRRKGEEDLVCTISDWNEEKAKTKEEKRRGGLGWERELQEKQGRGQRCAKAASGKETRIGGAGEDKVQEVSLPERFKVQRQQQRRRTTAVRDAGGYKQQIMISVAGGRMEEATKFHATAPKNPCMRQPARGKERAPKKAAERRRTGEGRRVTAAPADADDVEVRQHQPRPRRREVTAEALPLEATKKVAVQSNE
ncbi:hypothetical protein K438DRAFT_2101615 [Mycena galopus ATCC 62051]|nr:hypothetical protein K438DRAFT_2101615 [Mycena galopus ATCC 62051]